MAPQETVVQAQAQAQAQAQLLFAWMVTSKLLPPPLGLAVITWALGKLALVFQVERIFAWDGVQLRAAGLVVTARVGGRGVVAVLKGARSGRAVACGADMDAVPPEEFVTGGTGAAHVCGHDSHTAVGIGVARVLAKVRHRLSGTVVFFSSPARRPSSAPAR